MLYSFEKFSLDTGTREFRRDRQLLSVEPRVFDLIAFLIVNRERVVSKDDLISGVWSGRIVSDAALATCVNSARTTVGDSGDEQRLIKTLPRKGFRFVGVVQEEQPTRADAHAGASPPLLLPDNPSIAVLPFVNMSLEPQQDYFCDGVAEEIITALSRCAWLFVIARNSSFFYKGNEIDVRRIGRELGVRYVLEGSVRCAGDRLRITAQLVDANSGRQIWADRFNGDIRDVFDLQDRITESVVGAIEPQLQLAEIARLKYKPAPDFGAYDLLLRAQAFEYEFTEASLGAALSCTAQALAIDPCYAPAMALAAYCYAERHNQGWTSAIEEDAERGLELASRAVEFGKDDSTVLWMSAFAIRALGADPHRARELLDRSLLLNPNSALPELSSSTLHLRTISHFESQSVPSTVGYQGMHYDGGICLSRPCKVVLRRGRVGVRSNACGETQ